MNVETKQEIKRGDIFFADLNPVVGHEQGGKRPVLVIQNDTGNRHSPTVIIAPITSAIKKALPTHMPLVNIDGIIENSILMLEQIRTIDKSRLTSYVANLGGSTMKEVDSLAKVSLQLTETKKTDWMELCLCFHCAQQFRNSPDHHIFRANPWQTEKERCNYCNTRWGYDFIVISKQKICSH